LNYDAGYKSEDVVALVDAIAPIWKKAAKDCPGLDTEKLFKAFERVIEEWRKKESCVTVDKDLQALLAFALATAGWFNATQLKEVQAWLDEVAGSAEEDWMPNFPEEELREAVMAALKAKEVTDVTYDTVASGISVEFAGGNYGTGKHDGRLEISDDGLKLYDMREAGKYLLYSGEHPSNPEELRGCLKSKYWDIHWDGEEEEGGDGAGWSEAWEEGNW